jgi:hypothetical protein
VLAPRTDRTLARLIGAAKAPLTLGQLVDAGADRLPLPGAGRTRERWQMLALVAAHDLPLAKLYEGHTDALAILAELGGPELPARSRWGTWCAEPPDARVLLDADGRLNGTKAWCSGADELTHAVMSCWNPDGEPCLMAVALDRPGVNITRTGWEAVGMAATRSVDVHFDRAEATPLGAPGDYVHRAGFWHGGAGIAACWYGGAQGLADMTHQLAGPNPDPHRLAHLGAIDAALAGAAALLRETADWIDLHPQADARGPALRARLAVEQAAAEVLLRAGRALGAAPLCRNARFAHAMADLPVFLRQSHAERDLAALGSLVAASSETSWTL